MRQYQEGDDLRRIHWPSVARTGELMIRQDESSRRANGLVFLDTRDGALGPDPRPGLRTRGLGRGDPRRACCSRGGFSLAARDRRHAAAAALSEERFLEALAGVGALAGPVDRSRARAPARRASGDTTLVVVAAPPLPAELTSLIRSGGGLRPQARRPRLSRSIPTPCRPSGRPSWRDGPRRPVSP